VYDREKYFRDRNVKKMENHLAPPPPPAMPPGLRQRHRLTSPSATARSSLIHKRRSTASPALKSPALRPPAEPPRHRLEGIQAAACWPLRRRLRPSAEPPQWPPHRRLVAHGWPTCFRGPPAPSPSSFLDRRRRPAAHGQLVE
jgi:hypothetical protein